MSLETIDAPMRTHWPAVSPMRVSWMITAAIAIADVAGIAMLGFSVPLIKGGLIAGIALMMLGLCWIYTVKRPDARIAAASKATLFLIVFTLVLATLSYLACSLGWPLQDEGFEAFDRALGFYWPAHMSFVAERPALANFLLIAYQTSMPQVALVILVLVATQRYERLEQFLLLFAITATVVILSAAAWPSFGAFAVNLPPSEVLAPISDPYPAAWHMKHFLALRDGSLREIPLSNFQGLVSFPSFHTALALITVWALFPVRWFSAPIYVLNGVLIFSTLAIGGHYLADVIGGAFISLAAIALVSRKSVISRVPVDRSPA